MKNLKNIKTYIVLLTISFFVSTSCDDGFDEININKAGVTNLDPILLLNNATLGCSLPNNTLSLEMAIVQQVVTPNGGVIAGANFNQLNTTLTPGIWDRIYETIIKHSVDVIRATQDSPDRSNLYHMARIIKAFSAMVATDTYGDIPYFQAGLGFLDGTISPEYDTQRDIYLDILTELEQATDGLSTASAIESADILYNGDVTKWKKLGYSLMLRAAMRISNQEETLAQTYINTAVNGGLMESNEDNFVIHHDFNYQNDIGTNLNAQEASNYYMTGEFVDYLTTNNDPRLASIAVRYIGAGSGTDQNDAVAGNPTSVVISRDPVDQVGLPMGFDNGGATAYAQTNGLVDFYDMSQVDRTRMTAQDAPMYMVTYAQTQLLLAEAVVRGYSTGDAATIYATGIEAHMLQLSAYNNAAIPQADIDTYIAANPLNTGSELEDINTQYWVASFLNGPEAWANFRRSGFPDLAPNPFPGKDISGDFINRLPYPTGELTSNNANLQAALTNQGFTANDMDGVVWWDR